MNMFADPLKLSRFAEPFHAVLRMATALTFMSHGTMKLLGIPAMPAMPGQAAMGSPPVLSLMGVAGMLEMAGGFLVLIGLFTRPVAFLLSGEMAIAYWMAHAPRGPFPVGNGGESAYLFCFAFLWLAAAGAGPWSVDNRGKAAS
jgi:putative oxidoreductase